MRITFCWTHLSGYMAACFRALSARPGVEVEVLAFTAGAAAPFDDAALGGFSRRLLPPELVADRRAVLEAVQATRPDVLVISGWAYPAYVKLVGDPALRGVRTLLAADTPLRLDLRQRLAPLRIGGLLRRVDGVVVPGERGFQLMRYWGVPPERIHRGLYGIDFARLAPLLERRRAGPGGWPGRFLFVGRLAPEKGLEDLAEAYAAYRAEVEAPWPLTVCGTGPLEPALRGRPGVELRGFVQPGELPAVLLEAGAFVLPSRVDPWPLALVEACGAGLPVVCTQACGSAAELVRDFHNGLVVPAGDPRRLADALRWLHASAARAPAMGEASRALASAYDAERWADRFTAFARGAVRAEA